MWTSRSTSHPRTHPGRLDASGDGGPADPTPDETPATGRLEAEDETKASEASPDPGAPDTASNPRVCTFCETDSPPLGPDEKHHRACIDAWGLDYDPVDGHDAQRWLDRREAWIEAETRAGRVETVQLDVSELLLHPDLAEEGH